MLTELRAAGFDLMTEPDAEPFAAAVAPADTIVALPDCTRVVPVVAVADEPDPELRLRAAIDGAVQCVSQAGVALAIEIALAPDAPSLAEQRRRARIEALEALARADAQGSPRRVHLTRLEHRPVRFVSDPPPAASPLDLCTPKQRELLDLIAREGSVMNAAHALGTTRSSVYAALRRIAHRVRSARQRRLVAVARHEVIAIDDLRVGHDALLSAAAVVPTRSRCSRSRATRVSMSSRSMSITGCARERRSKLMSSRAAAQRFGAQMRVVHVDIDARANLEARARDARYDALERVRAEVDAAAILVGHTRDDQAETVLLHLFRGSGPAGLAGIPARRGSIRRPILDWRRAATRELCARLRLAPVCDPMNAELHHRRVWLRREVVPGLERGASRDLVEVLARQTEVFRDEDALLSALAEERLTDEAAAIAAMPPALARRVVRALLGSPPPSFATVERVLAVARGEAVATELPGGDRMQRVGGRLVRLPSPVHVDPVAFPLPGRAQCGPVAVEAWIEHGPPVAWPDGKWIAVCDADLVAERAELRPGTPLPVVADESVVWSVGYRVARRVRATAVTRRYLWMSAELISHT